MNTEQLEQELDKELDNSVQEVAEGDQTQDKSKVMLVSLYFFQESLYKSCISGQKENHRRQKPVAE